MNHTRSYAVEVNNHEQPQRRFAALNGDLQSTAYTAPQSQWVVAIQKFDGSSYLLCIRLHYWENGEQAFAWAQEQLSKVSRREYRERCMSMLVIKTVVGTARITRVRAECSYRSCHPTTC